jgi:hypothetical protein
VSSLGSGNVPVIPTSEPAATAAGSCFSIATLVPARAVG